MSEYQTIEELTKFINHEIASKNYGGAISKLEELKNQWENDAAFLELLGASYLAGDQVEQAETVLMQAQEISPKFETQFNLGECAFIRGDYALAINEFKIAHTLISNESYRSIVVFKIIVSELLCDQYSSSSIEKTLNVTGAHFLQIVQSIVSNNEAGALALLAQPQTNANDAEFYIDTLITADLIQT